MNKEDFIAWRSNPITEEFLEAILIEMDNLIADLAVSAGNDPSTDRYRCGAIQGLRFLADWQPIFDREETEEDES